VTRIGKTRFLSIMGLAFILITTVLSIHAPVHSAHNYYARAGPKVLFDYTKDEDAGNADWTINGGYSAWADNLTALGYTVDQLTTNPITYGDANNPQDLSNYAVYIIPEPQDSFNSSEAEAIREFVLNGGGLILISDHNGADRNSNGYDAVHIFNNYLNTAQYGITFNYDDVSKDPITDINTQGCPAITDNVSSIGIWNGATITPSGNATGLIFYNSTAPVVVNSTYGKGRVVALGDSSPFDDGTPDSSNSGDTLYDGWNDYNDSQLGINMVNWAANNTAPATNRTPLQSESGNAPWVSYGNGNYLITYTSGTYIYGYFVNASTGTESTPGEIYRYGAGAKTVYYPQSAKFAVVSYDYSLPSYHSVLCAFIDNSSLSATPYTVSNDANQSIGVAYGAGKLLIVWVNETREQVEGVFYDGSFGTNFTIAIDSGKKYDVAAAYDAQSQKFLVVWSENYDVRGRFITTSPDTWVSFPTTSTMKEALLSVAGSGGEFMVTYRNGTGSATAGAYFFMVSDTGTVSNGTINTNSAAYCGAAMVLGESSGFAVAYADSSNGSADVYVEHYSLNGVRSTHELLTGGSDAEESPVLAENAGGYVVVWYDYTASAVKGFYYPPSTVPELSILIILIVPLAVLLLRRRQ